MAKLHGRTSRLLVAEFDVSAFFNSVQAEHVAELADATGFNAGSQTFVVGLLGGTARVEGFYGVAAGEAESVLQAIFGGDTPKAFTWAPEGFAVAKRLQLAQIIQGNYNVTAPLRDVSRVGALLTADAGGIRGGVSLHAETAESATANGTSVDNTASSAGGAIANLHVITNSRSAVSDFKIQHSTDDSTFADLITFTQVGIAAKTSEHKSATGTVNRYARAVWTLAAGTGSVTFLISFART